MHLLWYRKLSVMTESCHWSSSIMAQVQTAWLLRTIHIRCWSLSLLQLSWTSLSMMLCPKPRILKTNLKPKSMEPVGCWERLRTFLVFHYTSYPLLRLTSIPSRICGRYLSKEWKHGISFLKIFMIWETWFKKRGIIYSHLHGTNILGVCL